MKRCAFIMLLFATAAGCARPTGGFLVAGPESKTWPQSPERPRVRFVGAIQGNLAHSGRRDSRGSFQKTVQTVLFGPAPSQRLVTPHAIAIHDDGRRVAIADTNAACVHVLDLATNEYDRVAPMGESGPLLKTPVGVAWADDRLCIADAGAAMVIVAELSSKQSFRIIGNGTLSRPASVAYDRGHQRLLVSDAGAHRIIAMDLNGSELARFGSQGAAAGKLNFPAQIACDAQGNIVVADAMNFRVQRFSPDGQPLGLFGKKGDAGGDFALPKGVAVDSFGNIWVVDAQFENVQAFDQDGQLLLAFGGEGHEPGEFWLPAGAAIDSEDRLWLADTYNRRVQVFQILP